MLCSAEYLLRLDGVEGESREVLEEMLASSQGIHRMVLNLLDVARLEDMGLIPNRSVSWARAGVL